MDYIEWNYMQAKRQANKLEEQAERLRTLAESQLTETLQNLSNNWQGESASDYIRKGEKMRSEISVLAKELRQTAGVIRSSAERAYRAEMRVRELAKKREY